MIHLLVLGYNIYLILIWLEKETRRKYIGGYAFPKILVMAHGSIRGSAINVTKIMKHNLFFGMQFLRQTTPHQVQLSLSVKISGIRIVMDHGERNLVLYIICHD